MSDGGDDPVDTSIHFEGGEPERVGARTIVGSHHVGTGPDEAHRGSRSPDPSPPGIRNRKQSADLIAQGAGGRHDFAVVAVRGAPRYRSAREEVVFGDDIRGLSSDLDVAVTIEEPLQEPTVEVVGMVWGHRVRRREMNGGEAIGIRTQFRNARHHPHSATTARRQRREHLRDSPPSIAAVDRVEDYPGRAVARKQTRQGSIVKIGEGSLHERAHRVRGDADSVVVVDHHHA